MAAPLERIPILLYHSISDNATPRFRPFVVSPEIFARQISYLCQFHYTPITITRFVQSVSAGRTYDLPRRPVILTFDDGFADFYTTAFPVLQKHGFTATLYVVTSFVGGTSRWLQREGETTRPMLNWDQLAEISASGIECGSHGAAHLQLDVIPHSMARDEIFQSKVVLEERLSQEVATFAYPFGYYTAAVRQAVQEVGYSSACAVKFAMSSPTDDPFSLSRLLVTAHTNMDGFVALLEGRISPVVTAYKQARTSAWRLVRRWSAHLKTHLLKATGSA